MFDRVASTICTCSVMIFRARSSFLAGRGAGCLTSARDTSVLVGRLAIQSVEQPSEPPAVLVLPAARHVLQRPQLVQDPLLLDLLSDDVLLDRRQLRRAFRSLERRPVILTAGAEK